jgi:RNA polymerase sigma factor (sigma-70 family)
MSPPPAEQFAARIFMGPALRAQPDRRLVELVRGGYDAAFEEIVRRYGKPLDRFAAGIVGGRSEDVTQDAFSKALLALRGTEARIELRPWLYRIVRNTALNDLRDRAPLTEELSERLPGARSAAAEVETREELRELMERLGALPEPQRAALVMRELEGLGHEEIAAALGVSGGAARQAIYRARAALREGLGLLIPLPALRMFAEHGAEMVKAGAATVLVAGTVGAGVAVEHHRGERTGAETADAATLMAGKKRQVGSEVSAADSSPPSGADSRSGDGNGDASGGGGGDGSGGSLGDGTRSGSNQLSGGGPGPSDPVGDSQSGEGSGRSGDDSSHSGSGSSGGSGSDGSGDRHGGGSSGGSSGSSGDDGGSSGGSGGGDDLSGGGGGSGPSGGDSSSGGEIESEPTTSDPTLGETTNGGDGTESSGGGSSGSGSSGSGSLSSTTTSGSAESP